jgi:hypothetical protein
MVCIKSHISLQSATTRRYGLCVVYYQCNYHYWAHFHVQTTKDTIHTTMTAVNFLINRMHCAVQFYECIAKSFMLIFMVFLLLRTKLDPLKNMLVPRIDTLKFCVISCFCAFSCCCERKKYALFFKAYKWSRPTLLVIGIR